LKNKIYVFCLFAVLLLTSVVTAQSSDNSEQLAILASLDNEPEPEPEPSRNISPFILIGLAAYLWYTNNRG
jgi:hypothetical protein